MPLPFLQVFPREIRDQIYTYVLASPSGAVTLSPWTVEVARSLSLLRTCKQIHRECKDIIWYHNRLDLREPTHLYRKFLALSKHRHVRRIRQLKLCLELMDRDELEWVASSARGLEEWCRVGRLESITLVTVWDKPRGIDEFKEVLNLRKYGECLDGRFYRDSSTWTRMVVNTGWPRFSHWGKQRWLKEMLLDSSGLEQLLREIHKVFGGQLYSDGILCFSNRKQVVEGISLDPRNGEIRIIPGQLSAQLNAVDSPY
ncbi:hypothetical protein EG329_014222 [Mollisiaceae sp. DMI_Dod_QoI]|nr:hypothetical protein EG329_014222 [Helotiales sp. DMI_Dod_QoI]